MEFSSCYQTNEMSTVHHQSLIQPHLQQVRVQVYVVAVRVVQQQQQPQMLGLTLACPAVLHTHTRNKWIREWKTERHANEANSCWRQPSNRGIR
jgi:hypothetical protein